MNLQQLTLKVQQLTQQLQQTQDLAKKISELPLQSILDPASLLHVSRNGISEKLTVQKIIESASSLAFNRLLYVGDFILDGNSFTVPELAQWLIENVIFQNASAVTFNVPFSASARIRRDVVFGNNQGQILRQVGLEISNDGIEPPKPAIPPNTVEITSFTVTDSIIGLPDTPVVGVDAITKLSQGWLLRNFTGPNLRLSAYNASSCYELTGENPSIDGVLTTGVPNQFEWDGQEFVIFRNSPNSMTIEHNIEDFQLMPFIFVSETDFIMAPYSIAKFKRRDNKIYLISYSVLGTANGMTLDTVQTVSELKTWLNGTFGFRNTENSFTSFFRNSNTASRTYNLQDKTGTIAHLDDIEAVSNELTVIKNDLFAYTLSLADANRKIVFVSPAGNTRVYVTVPNDTNATLPLGYRVRFTRETGGGASQVLAEEGVTVTGAGSVFANNTIVTLIKISANRWNLEASPPFILNGSDATLQGRITADFFGGVTNNPGVVMTEPSGNTKMRLNGSNNSGFYSFNHKVEYDSDVSAGYTDRSLVDKGFVNAGLALKANDADVLHKTGTENKIGDLNINGKLTSKSNQQNNYITMENASFVTTGVDYSIAFGQAGAGFGYLPIIQSMSSNSAPVDMIINNSGGNVGFGKLPTEKLDVEGNAKLSGLLFHGQFTTGTQPAHQQGTSYYNTSIGKMKIGGATGWETISST